ncbi:MAG: TDP-N-acetylfucosamine:lipid II N-acetylfucosaminyltransferase [Eubacteriales bacterium]|nr:TDP-N-acetylfucosamine:lipid II N-acetylfucosaminyltransferase [Eubacteriales bacterium]
MKKNFYVKYIHLLYGHDTKFSGSLVKMINDPENGFDTSEHLFITRYKNVYDELCKYDNVMLDEYKGNFYRKYYRHCHLMISHGGEGWRRDLLTPRRIKKKIVHRYWGGSRITGIATDNMNFIRKIKVKIRRFLFKKNYESYAAIGVANNTDILDLSRILKGVKYYQLSYVSGAHNDILNRVFSEMKERQNEGKKKVLLGHRGTSENNHIELLKKLKVYDPEKFEIYVLLSYGDKEYIDKVKKFIEDENYSNVTVIDKFMQFEDFARFLSCMDIAIFDGTTSYALGNISIMLYFKKIIYLNSDGIICKAFDGENSPHRLTSDIGKITFEQFIEPIKYPDDFSSALIPDDIKTRTDKWKKMLADFD